MNNPFSVKTPESLSSKDIVDLFVDVYNDFSPIQDVGHTFIHGARGTGKSMMLRYLEPKVQLQAGKVNQLSDLPFLAIHIPIKLANLNISEIGRLAGVAFSALAEHMLLMHIGSRVFVALEDLSVFSEAEVSNLRAVFCSLLEEAGSDIDLSDCQSCKSLSDICDKEFRKVIQYVKRHAFSSETQPYQGALCDYMGFLVPLVQLIRKLDSSPSGPLFLMLDDADNLGIGMQKIINSWVSCRTTDDLCLKISTQMRYKTWRTTSNQLIEAPHDYSEVNVNTIYTSNLENYKSRVESIVTKRLLVAGIETKPELFFPANEKQALAMAEIRKEITAKWKDGDGRGFRASDDVVRYSRPEYMRRLSTSRSSANYSYAGFKSLVDLSSGIIRWFLEPAARMFNEANNTDGDINYIDVNVQDKVIRSWSEDFLLSEFEKLKKDESELSDSGIETDSKVEKLYVLICSLGALFRSRLLDDSLSERRIISIMIKPSLPDDLDAIIRLGIEWGYFHESTIGSKEGLGRNKRLVLSRRLAPYFKLDPSGYAGYVQLTESDLRLACVDTPAFLRSRKNSQGDEEQLSLI